MNVKKNPLYYANVGVFVLLAVYSLLVSINAFDFKNIDMNAGLCAVVAAMVVALLMYLVHATRLAMVLYSSPLAKTTLEIISVLIFLTVACVARIYFVGEFEIYIVREAIVLGCMFMAYLVARMLNQFGFLTLLVLTPWPYFLNSYELAMSDLIVIAELMAVMLVITFILHMVRHQAKLKSTLMVVFVLAVVGVLAFVMDKTGLQIIKVGDVKQYLYMFEDVLVFGEIERFYYIAAVMAAITGAVRMWLGKGSGNSLAAFAASAGFLFMICCGVGNEYMYMMYLLLAIVASGACGTRPAYMDMEVQLVDDTEMVSVQQRRRDNVEVADESELDKMLDELESAKPYGSGGGAFNPIKFAAEQEKHDEELPIELQMYDFGASSAEMAPATQPVVKEEKPVETIVEEVAVEAVAEEIIEETVEEVAEEIVEETVEEFVDVVEEAEFEQFVPQTVENIQEVSDDAVIEMIVDDVEISEVEITPEPVVEAVVEESEVEESVVEEASVEMTGSLTETEEFEMPTFEMPTFEMDSTVSDDLFEEAAETVDETLVAETVEESASVVVEDESAVSITESEEFSMPTFEMDSVAVDNVARMFTEEVKEEIVEETEEVEEVVEEVTEKLVVEADNVASIAEEFEMPTFEMNEFVETEAVLEEIVAAEPEEIQEENVVSEPELETEPEPVVLVENPIFIRNPINFNRTRAYDEQSTEERDYGFVQSAPTFETMGSFLADNKENSFPEFATSAGAMDDFLSEFVTEEKETEVPEAETEVVEETVEEVFDNFESISVDAYDEAEEDDYEEVVTVSEDAASIFEYVAEENKMVDDIEMPGFMAAELESGDLFGTFSLESDDEDDFEENSSEEIVMEPESVDLGLDLGEEFSFGQAQSLTDLYDYDSVPQTFAFEEPVTETVEETIEEFVEEVAEESVETVEEVVSESSDIYTYEYEDEEEEVVAEAAAPAKDDDLYDWNAEEVRFDEEVSEEVVEAPKANDSDFFDWNAVDTYNYDDEESVVEETSVQEDAPAASSNAFEEFVWTDEMISELAREEAEEVAEAAQEVAASMEEYDYSEETVEVEETVVEESSYTMPEDDEPAQYEVFQSSGNFVPEVEDVVEETQYEVFQSSGNFVPEVEEVVEETQYEVFQSSGNFVPEVEEVTEETQYEVFQSSGNFVPEAEEVVDETQYEVFESSGNFEVEPEVVEEVTMYKTYGEEDDEEEKSAASSKKKDDDDDGFSMDFPDFDLDLPDF